MAGNYGSFVKKSVPYLYLGGGFCAGLALLYPHTLGLEQYKNLMAIHTPEGKEELVDIEIVKMAEEIKRDFGWSKRPLEATETISLFLSSSSEIFHLGTAKTKWSSYLGVPKYFVSKYQDEKYMDDLFQLLEIDPSSEDADNLRQSFNISDAAKRYALARELKLCKSYQIFFIAAGAQTAISCLYLIPNVMSTLLPFQGVRVLSFLAMIPIMYFGAIDLLKHASRFSQKAADTEAASLSFETASGGVEYYDSIILRKKILSNVRTAKSDTHDYCLEMAKQSWDDSFMTLQERKEHLEKVMKTLY